MPCPLLVLVLAGEGRRFEGEPLPGWVVLVAGLAVLVAILLAGLAVRRRGGSSGRG